MLNGTKKTYPRWLFRIEVIVILGVYLSILNSLKKYLFEDILSEDTIFIYLFILIITLAFVIFIFTLLTDTYYNHKKRAYDNYVRKVNRLRRKGKYCSQSKYTISLIIGFAFFISILGISMMKALSSKDEIFFLVGILSVLGLFGFIKIILSGTLYSLLSKKHEEN